MERLLDAIANRLTIRVTTEEQSEQISEGVSVSWTMYEHKPISEDIRKIFKKEFNNHLFTKLTEAEIGDSVEYLYECGNVRPIGTILDYANDNMADVLDKLPKLEEGEQYDLPTDTYIGFILQNKGEDGKFRTKISGCSKWIIDELSK